MDQAFLFNTGKNHMSYKFLGSRPDHNTEGEPGYRFAVWAPHAVRVCVVGDFNNWEVDINNLEIYGATGIWVGFIPDLQQFDNYKYAILTQDNEWLLKADPYARHAETRPDTASKLYDPDDFVWTDKEYLEKRQDAYDLKPLNIYEVHLGSWRRYPDGSVYNYKDIAPQLADYVIEMGYNAIELMPITEYPLDASWGYQVTGYYAATSRYGTPADLKFMINHFHEKGIHVFLDWVPAHFPKDAFGLAKFDGTSLYEYADPMMAEHSSWGTLVFDYSKAEVRSFLISNAYYWLNEFHFDGLRVDAVSSMFYRDYDRTEYVPNIHGGRENLEAISLFKEINTLMREKLPGTIMMAEESTPFPLITTGVDRGGIGFTFKWNMGWMNDTLYYNSLDHYLRKHHHNAFTFSLMYAFSERYILPFSHDEVVHGKGTLLGRMPGDYWRKFANLRTIFAYQMAHPGAKLNFMGNEYAPFTEWRYYEELEWFMLDYPSHKQMQDFVKNLNHLYLEKPALWENDNDWDGFKWVQAKDSNNSIFAFMRFNAAQDKAILCVLNMTPAVKDLYTLGLPKAGDYKLILNSDEGKYGGSDYLDEFPQKEIYSTYHPEVVNSENSLEDKPEVDGKNSDNELKENNEKNCKEELYTTTVEQISQIPKKVFREDLNNLDIVVPPLCAMYFEWQSVSNEDQDNKELNNKEQNNKKQKNSKNFIKGSDKK